jgi:hypothetical protein
MLSVLLAATISCGGIDDTLAIQEAVAAGNVVLSGPCIVNGMRGVQVPSNRTIQISGSVGITSICVVGRVCRIFETVPGAENVDFSGPGEVLGNETPAPGWQVLLRLDSARHASIRNLRFRQFRPNLADAVYVGGNAPATDIVISGLLIDGASRNGISVTNAERVLIEHVTCINGKVGASPGACIDVEHNPGERVRHFTAFDISSYDHEVGIYIHRHEASPQGEDFLVARSRFVRSRSYGLIMNSVIRGRIVDSLIEDAPRGISIGSHVEATRAQEITLAGNTVRAARPLILAGVRDLYAVENDLSGIRPETPTLGATGTVLIKPRN